ncbi:MAG: hypothetical protein LLF94_02220, partial [Chlamydiales bacterium]|nr:hypothetical protein [Chlamydiales bacterium]
ALFIASYLNPSYPDLLDYQITLEFRGLFSVNYRQIDILLFGGSCSWFPVAAHSQNGTKEMGLLILNYELQLSKVLSYS